MWIKASGVWLAEAETREAFVPVGLDLPRAATGAEAPGAEKAEGSVPAAENPAWPRPSIETTVHAVLPTPVVLDTHCVAAIAAAIRPADAAGPRRRDPRGRLHRSAGAGRVTRRRVSQARSGRACGAAARGRVGRVCELGRAQRWSRGADE
jgi:hypothetical protein